ncbi:MAG TPA: DUF2911 domain-containing protein [Bryobacteraceae bacterium]|nr:DUF2911 domain-containing protein [Bryobacteraceae bacterium]
MRNLVCGVVALLALSAMGLGQEKEASATLAGRTVAIRYAAPASKDRASLSLHTTAALAFEGFNLPKGDYTLYILASGPQWRLAINKAASTAAAQYDQTLDAARVPMIMTRPVTPESGFSVTLSNPSPYESALHVMWNGVEAIAPFHLVHGPGAPE